MNCDLKVPVDQVVDLEILVVVTPGVEKRLGHLDPAQVSDELQDWEPGQEDDRRVTNERSL